MKVAYIHVYIYTYIHIYIYKASYKLGYIIDIGDKYILNFRIFLLKKLVQGLVAWTSFLLKTILFFVNYTVFGSG